MNAKAKEILEILRNFYKINLNDFAVISVSEKEFDIFKTLVITILTQNSTDKAALKAFKRLETLTKITPQNIVNLDISLLKNAIREAGLHNTKAKALKELSKIIITKYNGSLDFILKMDMEKARKILMSLPKVGPKTADVILLMLGKMPTIPIDTHINRVSKRLGLVPQKSNYENTRSTLMKLYNPNEYLEVHLLLIQHGRKTCKAINPKCLTCPLNKLCDYYSLIKNKNP
jgi:endonuclease-3